MNAIIVPAVIDGIIEKNKDKLHSVEYNKLKHKSVNAAKNIKKYHAHLLQAQNQNTFWSDLTDNSGEAVQMIADFPQQKAPEWNLQMQTQYFGLAAIANWHMVQIKKQLPTMLHPGGQRIDSSSSNTWCQQWNRHSCSRTVI